MGEDTDMPAGVIMPPTQKQSLKAQSLVEFALVLPIFLLVVLGIFTFGHLFFTYTQVVAASREAARFGAAVGLTDNFIQSYRDCAGIRQSAERIGRFAGVEANSAIVQISYDQGPMKDGTDPVVYLHGCPDGGIGPGYIELGDRIVVTVSVMYRSITPLIDIGEFPITATTRRTIILGMPVGDVPVAMPLCTGTLTRVIPPTFNTALQGSFSRVGEAVTFDLEVISDIPGTTAPGTVSLYVDKTYTATKDCTGPSPYVSCAGQKMFTWYEVGEHLVRAEFITDTPSGSPCYANSRAEPVRHFVLPSFTTTEILEFDPDPVFLDEMVLVSAVVRPVAPGAGIPEGYLVFKDEHGNSCKTTDPISQYNTEDAAWGSCPLPMTVLGMNRITAEFEPILVDGLSYYDPSSGFDDVEVVYKEIPTLIPTEAPPTPIPPSPEPVPTIDPAFCPVLVQTGTNPAQDINFSLSEDSLAVNIHNPADISLQMDSITVEWQVIDPISNLLGIKAGPPTVAACSGDSCQWAGSPKAPPSFTVYSGQTGWSAINAVLPSKATTQIRFDFNNNLQPDLPYRVVITLAKDPLLSCQPIEAVATKSGN
jgi:hypothetical protein